MTRRITAILNSSSRFIGAPRTKAARRFVLNMNLRGQDIQWRRPALLKPSTLLEFSKHYNLARPIDDFDILLTKSDPLAQIKMTTGPLLKASSQFLAMFPHFLKSSEIFQASDIVVLPRSNLATRNPAR
jgi:hypothetical protein